MPYESALEGCKKSGGQPFGPLSPAHQQQDKK